MGNIVDENLFFSSVEVSVFDNKGKLIICKFIALLLLAHLFFQLHDK